MRRMRSVAYIRRSLRSRSDPGDVSREFQVDEVRRLAGADADLLILDGDWGRSGATDKTARRLEFLAMLEAIERGEVIALYAYASDRLARSVEWSARLLNACRRAGVVIVTSEGRFEPDNPMTDQLFYFQAMQNEGYSRQATQKRRATVTKLRERGVKMGPEFYGAKPGEDIAAVLSAFEETGSTHGAARLLNGRGVPTRRGGKWVHGSVRAVLVREGRMPALGTRGVKPKAPFAFYRLLRCHCGRILSGAKRPQGAPIYRCINGASDPDHGPKSVAEPQVLPWAMAEAARLAVPADDVALNEENEAERSRLEAKRDRVIDAYADGAIDKAERDRRLVKIDEAIGKLNRTAVIVALPAIRWDRPPEAVNAALRALWSEVTLGPDMRPVRAEWLVPEWRA